MLRTVPPLLVSAEQEDGSWRHGSLCEVAPGPAWRPGGPFRPTEVILNEWSHHASRAEGSRADALREELEVMRALEGRRGRRARANTST